MCSSKSNRNAIVVENDTQRSGQIYSATFGRTSAAIDNRVRSTVDGHERALLEGQLRLIVQEPKTGEAATGKVGLVRR
jgi:hypothetical protein